MLINASKGRYYAQVEQKFERCKNCDELGHVFKNCPFEFVQKCYFCLGPHHKEKCELNYCFQCAASGHRSSNCPERHARSCRRCNKRGHMEATCSILINFRDINHRTFEQERVERRRQLCLNCGGEGHTQCYLKGSDIIHTIRFDDLYNKHDMRDSLMQLGVSPHDLPDEEMSRPRQILSKGQRRKKLNELQEEEAEFYTLDQFHHYLKSEDDSLKVRQKNNYISTNYKDRDNNRNQKRRKYR